MVPLTLHPAALREGTQRAVGETLGKKTTFLSGTLAHHVASTPSTRRHRNPRGHLLKFPGSDVSKERAGPGTHGQ